MTRQQLDHERENAVVQSSNHPDYPAVEIPAKSPTEYSYVERRAELLQLVEQAGHWKALNQTELADRYGVTQQQISKDFDRLQEYLADSLGDRRDLSALPAYDRAIQDLFEQGEPYKAALVVSMRDEYLSGREYDLELKARLERLEEIQERAKYR